MNGKQNSDERELDQWLAREFQRSTEYIDDNGFTDQVMARLPAAPVSERTRGFRPLLVAVVIGLLVGLAAVLTVPVPPLLAALLGGLMAAPLTVWLQVGGALSLLAMLGAGYWVWREA